MSPDEIPAAVRDWLYQHPYAVVALFLLALAVAAAIADWLARRVIAAAVRKRLRSSSSGPFATALLESRVLLRFAQLAPALVLFFGVRAIDLQLGAWWTRALDVLAFA